MKLRSRGRNPAKRYVNINDTSLDSQEAQKAAADPLIQDILRRLLKVESISALFLVRRMIVSVLKARASPWPTFFLVWRSWRRLQIWPPV